MKNYGVNDYYNYMNNNYNQPLYNQQSFNNMNKVNSKLFDPYTGFISGNMFPDLYNAYKLSNPLEIEPMNEQAELLTNIDALCFACIDLNLYLDLYPEDKSAIELFKAYPKLKQFYARCGVLWSRGYFVSTVGHISEATVIKYIEEQKNDK